MTDKHWARIEELFHAAKALPEASRGDFLQSECAGDVALFEAVETLLQHADHNTELDDIVGQAAQSVIQTEQDLTGKRIGPWRVLSVLGQGGMGAVYLAQRDDDHYQKKVAIKLIRQAAASQELMQRFLQERQILANLEHRYIARLLDGGTTEDGLPYLVMEYVEGQPIDDYCQHHQLDINARLQLFRKVCSAVQYAHRKLVVHRDLKPSNLLVSGGEPRLLDFGIAKLLDGGEESRSSVETRQQQRLLTPQYSSPEQIRGEPVSTVTDVYALGIILYELLTGKRPFGNSHTSNWEVQKAVLETMPARPSIMVGQIDQSVAGMKPDQPSKFGKLNRQQLQRKLRGDLDNIVMKALRKEPEQRYESVAQFAQDIEQVLQHRPVSARPLSWSYRVTRFVQRNPFSTGLTTLLLLAVIGFTINTAVQSRLLKIERDVAQRQNARAQSITAFLTGMFSEIEPDKAQGKVVTVREVLDKAAGQLDTNRHALSSEHLLEADIRHVIGRIYSDLGILSAAQNQLQKSLELYRRQPAADASGMIKTMNDLSGVYHQQFAEQKRLELNLEALKLSNAINGENHHDTIGIMNNIAGTYHMLGNFVEAEQRYLDVLQKRRHLLGENHRDTLSTIYSLGTVSHWAGHYAKAEEYYRSCLSRSRKALGEMNSQTILCLSALGSLMETTGQYAKAEPLLKEHIAKARLILGDQHPSTLRSMHNLADVYRGLGRYNEAEKLFMQTIDLRASALGEQHLETLQSRMKLARLYGLMGRSAKGLTLIDKVITIFLKDPGAEHPTTLIAQQIKADLLRINGQPRKAISSYQSLLTKREKALGSQHPEIIDTLAGLSLALADDHQSAKAKVIALRAEKLASTNPGFNSLNLPNLQQKLAN